jgi:hypothetical protein
MRSSTCTSPPGAGRSLENALTPSATLRWTKFLAAREEVLAHADIDDIDIEMVAHFIITQAALR